MSDADNVERPFWLVVFVVILLFAIVLLGISSNVVRWGVEKETEWIEEVYGPASAQNFNEKTKDLYREYVTEPRVKSSIYEYFNINEKRLYQRDGLQKMHRWAYPWLLDRIDAFMMMLWWLIRRLCMFSMWFALALPAFGIAIMYGYWERRIAQTNFTFSSPILRLVSWKLTCTMVGFSIVSFILPFPLPPVLVPVIVIGVAGLVGISLGNVAKRF